MPIELSLTGTKSPSISPCSQAALSSLGVLAFFPVPSSPSRCHQMRDCWNRDASRAFIVLDCPCY
jgi:hypothetical protein